MKEVLSVCTNFILTLLFPLVIQTSSFLKHFIYKKHRIYKIILNTKIKYSKTIYVLIDSIETEHHYRSYKPKENRIKYFLKRLCIVSVW